MTELLQVKNIRKSYNGQVVLNDLSLTLSKGDIYGLIGVNGAGKTTLIRLITGLAKCTGGKIFLYGHNIDVPSSKPFKKRISAIVEAPSLVPTMTGYENMVLQAKLTNKNTYDIDHYLRLVRLNTVAHSKKKVKDYSLGMRQRLAIAQALISEPEILILDEPANGLDPEGIKEIRDIIKLLHEKGVTILISSHLLDELSKVATKYGILHKGKIIKEITKEELVKEEQSYHILQLSSLDRINEVMESLGIEKYKILKDNRLVIPLQESITPIVEALKEKETVVLNIQEHQTTVEDYFLRLIRGAK